MDTYKTDLLDLRHCDCLDLMRGLPDKAFALAIVDPPYGIERFQHGQPHARGKHGNKTSAWDTKPTQEYWDELFRVSVNQIVWGANNFTLPPSEYFAVWSKHQTVKNFSSAEYAWVSMGLKQPAMVFDYSIHQHNSDVGKIHPTQKPVALYRWLLANYAKPGDTILDTHLGSMSSAVACHYAGFRLTGCELDADYFASGVERVKRETAQLTLGI